MGMCVCVCVCVCVYLLRAPPPPLPLVSAPALAQKLQWSCASAAPAQALIIIHTTRSNRLQFNIYIQIYPSSHPPPASAAPAPHLVPHHADVQPRSPYINTNPMIVTSWQGHAGATKQQQKKVTIDRRGVVIYTAWAG